jgi:hypothetical protein
MHITIEVRGGLVQAVYADDPSGVTMTLVDWDHHEVGGQAVCQMEVQPHTTMPKDTAKAVRARRGRGTRHD